MAEEREKSWAAEGKPGPWGSPQGCRQGCPSPRRECLGSGWGIGIGQEGTEARHIPHYCCFPEISRKPPVPGDRQAKKKERDPLGIQISLAVKSPRKGISDLVTPCHSPWKETGGCFGNTCAAPRESSSSPFRKGSLRLGGLGEVGESFVPKQETRGGIWAHTKEASWESIKENQQRLFTIDPSYGILEFVLNENSACLTSGSCSAQF